MKPRHHLYLDDELTERLEALAAKPGSSKSAIVSDALRSYLAHRGAKEIEELLRVRLDRIGNQLNRIERNEHVILESLALFVRYQLTVTAPLPETDQAARAVGHERFHAFIDQVARGLADGRSASRDLLSNSLQDAAE